jgi:anthranilate phosphoribosyltransferase
MLEVLGIRLDLSPQRIADVFRETGITFLFAPVFHPAMRYVAPIRKELGVPTTFNFLGPLANPAQPIATSLGVANPVIAPLMAKELAQRGRSGLVFRGSDGLDELTTTGSSQIWQVSGGVVREFELNPDEIGLSRATLEDLIGGDPQHNANVAKRLFESEFNSPVAEIVKLNAAAGVVAYELAKDSGKADESIASRFETALANVTDALESGRAAQKLSSWMDASQA